MSELEALGTRYVRSDKTGIDYDLLVRLAQDFRMRYPLVDGRGNFGSVDGDPAADARYTEVRLSPLGRERARFPNALVNGFPPHNLREACDAVLAVLDNPRLSLDGLLAVLPGPDFPTGGVLVDPAEIRAVYTGRPGTLRLRARVHVEARELVVTELPFGVSKGGDGGVIREIVERVVDGSLPGVRDIQDHPDARGMRLRILADDPHATLERLYAATSLEIAVPVHFDPRALIEDFLEGRDPETVRRELPELARRHGDARRTTIA